MAVKRYYGEAHFYICPKCRKQVLSRQYYGLFDLIEMEAAKSAGLIRCTCPYCGACELWDRLKPKWETLEVSREEALATGLAFESKGLQ